MATTAFSTNLLFDALITLGLSQGLWRCVIAAFSLAVALLRIGFVSRTPGRK